MYSVIIHHATGEMTGIIILNYNGSKDTIECVESIYDSGEVNYKIIIVDNGSGDEDINTIRSWCKRDEVVIATGENLGYAAGNNIGIREAAKLGCGYICILNNDVIVKKYFLTPCVKYLEENEDTVMVGPIVIDYNTKKIQSNGARINIWTGDTPGINNGYSVSVAKQVTECDYIGGACIVFRTSDLSYLGFIPEKYFLLYEETEWCYQAKKRGRKVVSISTSQVEHKGAASLSKIDGLNGYLYERNRVVFVRDNCDYKIQYAFFIIYNYFRILFRAMRRGKKYLKQISYMGDGMKNRIDKKYAYIKINEDY